MATSVQSTTWRNTTSEEFRRWGKAISDGIRAVGLVQTADTGQINWATVAAPTSGSAVGTVQGHEIWQFDDALQATAPIFVKIEYGARVATEFPEMWVTLGRGSDGVGNITGILAPRRAGTARSTTYGSSGFRGDVIEPIYISSDGSSLCIAPRTGAVTAGQPLHVPTFVIDRSRDSSGAATAAGGVILAAGDGSVSQPASPAATAASLHAWTYAGDYTMGDVPAVAPRYVNSPNEITGAASLVNGDKAPVFPYVVCVPNHEPWQVLAAVGVLAGDCANGPFTANTLGRIRNYRALPVNEGRNRWMSGTGPGWSGLCILWEE